jgi:hypothetical protein
MVRDEQLASCSETESTVTDCTTWKRDADDDIVSFTYDPGCDGTPSSCVSFAYECAP